MCLLRLIASFEGFRKAAFGASLSLLLGMPLMTFDKFLREEHAIEFRAGAGRSVTLLSGGGVVRQYEDDELSSITGQLVFRLRALYPEADPLFSSPLVQTVRGASVDSILRGFDLSDVFDNFVGVEGAQEQLRDFDVSAFNNVAEALLDDNPANFLKNRAVDMLHQLVVAARTSDPQVVVGDQLPFNTDAEFMDVWLGMLPDRSLKMPGGKRLSKAIISHFTEIYPDAALSPCGTELRRGGTVFRLFDVLGLSEFPHPPPHSADAL